MTKRQTLGSVGKWSLVVMAALGELSCSSSDPQASEPPASMPGPSGAACPDPSLSPSYEGFAREFFGSYCVRCHSSTVVANARHGAPKSVNFDSLEGVRAVPADTLDQVAAAGPLQRNAFMPPSEPAPSPAERESLGKWLACGLPP